MQNDAIEVNPAGIDAIDTPAASIPLVPILTCIAAGLALALTPAMVWRLKTGSWVCLRQPETLYYLQIAAQPYYNHRWYLSDPVVPGGAIFYPWLQFVPPVLLVRVFGLSIFSVALIWSFCAGVGLGASLYLLFWRFLRRPWLPAALTVFCLSDIGFCGNLPVVLQLKGLVSALGTNGTLNLQQIFLQWRAPEPALALPFLFLQILAVSIARERPRRLNLWMSGIAFGLLFYVFFYLWTMVAAGLFIAMFIDRSARRVYLWTISIGVVIGLPQLSLNLWLRAAASPEGAMRLGVLAPVSDFPGLRFPFLSLVLVILVFLWIQKSGRLELLYLLSLTIAGMLLFNSGTIIGRFYHEYHYMWLWWPIRFVLAVIVIATVAKTWILRSSRYSAAFAVFLILYFVSAIYLNAIEVTRTGYGQQQIQDFVKYKAQRMAPRVAPLAPRSVVAGSELFCELAGIAENQRMLGGWTVPLSVALDNSSWESRYALNAFLMGVGRSDFARTTAADIDTDAYYFLKPIRPQLKEGFMRQFDQVTRDPDNAVRALEVRYVALPAGQPPPPYVASRFNLLQPGPYWQIWQIKNL